MQLMINRHPLTTAPTNLSCFLCYKTIPVGSPAHIDTIGPTTDRPAMHPACFEPWAARIDRRTTIEAQAKANPHIAVRFGMDSHETRFVVGALDDQQARALPADFPIFDEAQVLVEERVRRPVAHVMLYFMEPKGAEEMWIAATANAGAAYEIYMYADQDTLPVRHWAGRGFGAARSHARIAELEAGTI